MKIRFLGTGAGAEIDHTLGLVTLREGSEVTVYATSTVLRACRG